LKDFNEKNSKCGFQRGELIFADKFYWFEEAEVLHRSDWEFGELVWSILNWFDVMKINWRTILYDYNNKKIGQNQWTK
jgi:hypothetical protein